MCTWTVEPNNLRDSTNALLIAGQSASGTAAGPATIWWSAHALSILYHL
jgi:hypothetical protein